MFIIEIWKRFSIWTQRHVQRRSEDILVLHQFWERNMTNQCLKRGTKKTPIFLTLPFFKSNFWSLQKNIMALRPRMVIVSFHKANIDSNYLLHIFRMLEKLAASGMRIYGYTYGKQDKERLKNSGEYERRSRAGLFPIYDLTTQAGELTHAVQQRPSHSKGKAQHSDRSQKQDKARSDKLGGDRSTTTSKKIIFVDMEISPEEGTHHEEPPNPVTIHEIGTIASRKKMWISWEGTGIDDSGKEKKMDRKERMTFSHLPENALAVHTLPLRYPPQDESPISLHLDDTDVRSTKVLQVEPYDGKYVQQTGVMTMKVSQPENTISGWRSPRLPYILWTQAEIDGHAIPEVLLSDVSATGCMIEIQDVHTTNIKLSPCINVRVKLSVLLKQYPWFHGTVVWKGFRAQNGFHQLGIKFMNQSTLLSTNLSATIQQLARDAKWAALNEFQGYIGKKILNVAKFLWRQQQTK